MINELMNSFLSGSGQSNLINFLVSNDYLDVSQLSDFIEPALFLLGKIALSFPDALTMAWSKSELLLQRL